MKTMKSHNEQKIKNIIIIVLAAVIVIESVAFDGISWLCDPSKLRSCADDLAPVLTKDRCRICRPRYLSRFDASVKQAAIKDFGLSAVSA